MEARQIPWGGPAGNSGCKVPEASMCPEKRREAGAAGERWSKEKQLAAAERGRVRITQSRGPDLGFKSTALRSHWGVAHRELTSTGAAGRRGGGGEERRGVEDEAAQQPHVFSELCEARGRSALSCWL